jgi:DNA-nicking Smr family endonuclease
MDDRKLTDEEKNLWRAFTKTVSPLGEPSNSEIAASIIAQIDVDLRKDRQTLPKPRKKDTRKYQKTLDLHGMTRDQAHKALETFLCAEKMHGTACVLIITGKGHGKGEGLGILKRKVPLWLEISKIVKRWSIASPQDGGEGALYVYLK